MQVRMRSNKGGVSIFIDIYHGTSEDTLGRMRFHKYAKQGKNGTFKPEALPPTTDAAELHAPRAWLQTADWLNLVTMSHQPTDFACIVNGSFEPVARSKAMAPEALSNLISCNCHGDCSTLRCPCCKNGLKCISACGNCHGVNCKNHDDYDGDDDA